MEDPYTVLGVSRTATQAEITHAYRRQLRDYHPDRRAGDHNSGADERLRQILAAYALLRDPRRRAAYDRAHPVRTSSVPVRIPVTRRRFGRGDRPPLWVGPVRWER
ncbi:J domain-containing protein [Mycobacterium sp.]|uniref:J domain-containing protein n=1 Tax=Mycobacterium sp. TaxID=1785 RepID=UPI0012878884|nr:J domain-containing protein [Mycobacterium sp.]KAA8963418.1 MAG: J domain-containing protein [Mycobacterium sp.]